MKRSIIPILFSLLLFSCGEPVSQQNSVNTANNDSTSQIVQDLFPVQDSIMIRDTLTLPEANSDSFELTNLQENMNARLYVNYLNGIMKDIENPIRMQYDGAEFGDYFHLLFYNSDNLYLDFGDGANDLGEYELYNPVTFENNPKFMGKTFDIYWEFRVNSFYCCDGAMESVTAKVPSIVKLKLIEE